MTPNELDSRGTYQASHQHSIDPLEMSQSEVRPRSDKDKSTPSNEFLETAVPVGVWPHHLIFTVRRRDGSHISSEPLFSWSVLYPTRDAALSQMRYIQHEMRRLRGMRPWSEIARITKCKAPHLLSKHQNINMDILPKEKKRAPARPKSPLNVSNTARVLQQSGGAVQKPAGLDEFLEYLRAAGLVIVPADSISRHPKRNPTKRSTSPNRPGSGNPLRPSPKPKKRVPSSRTSRKGNSQKSPKNPRPRKR